MSPTKLSPELEILFLSSIETSLPTILFDCGAFSWIKTKNFLEERNWVALKSMSYVLPHYKGIDLDTKDDLELLSFYFKKYVLNEI